MESNSTSYSSEDESKYEIQVPETILVVGENFCCWRVNFQPLLARDFLFLFQRADLCLNMNTISTLIVACFVGLWGECHISYFNEMTATWGGRAPKSHSVLESENAKLSVTSRRRRTLGKAIAKI